MNKIKESTAKTFGVAKEYALRYLSYRPRSIREVGQKLADKGYDRETTGHVIEFLKDHKFLDDEAFTCMWIRNRTREKPCGRRRIYTELLQKGIDKNIIEQYLGELSPQKEAEMAAALVAGKCRRTAFDYRKLSGFLLRRGFSPSTVKSVLSEFSKSCSDE